VETYLKGALGAALSFRVPGGVLGRLRSIVVGAPEFSVDDRVIVFLGARGPSVPYVLGLSQGVFRLVAASDNSGWLVPPQSSVAIPRDGRCGSPSSRIAFASSPEASNENCVGDAPRARLRADTACVRVPEIRRPG